MPIMARRQSSESTVDGTTWLERLKKLDAAKKEAKLYARIDALEAQLAALLNALGAEDDEADEGETDLDGNPIPTERGQHDSL